MPNTLKPFKGTAVLITENTTLGTYQIQVFSTPPTGGTVTSTLNFTDAQFAAYKQALLHLLSMDV